MSKRYLWLFALQYFGMALTATIYTPYLRTAGLTEVQVNLVNVAFFLTITLAEAPTGAFADVYGRRSSVALGLLLKSVGFLIYGLSNSWTGFVVGEVLSGFGVTFISGAFNAWLVDASSQEDEWRPAITRKEQIIPILGIVAGSSGALLYGVNKSLPWFLGGVFTGIAALLAWLLMQESYRNGKHFHAPSKISQAVHEGFKLVKYSPKLLRLGLLLGALTLAVQAVNMQWQPRFVLGENPVALSIAWIVIACANFLGATYSRRKGVDLTLPLFVVGLGIVLSGILPLYPAMMMFVFHQLGRGMVAPVREVAFHRAVINPSVRATADSMLSVLTHAAGVVGLIMSGLLADQFGYTTSWGVSGLLLLVVILRKRRGEA